MEIWSEDELTVRLVKVETQNWQHIEPVLVNEAATLVISTFLNFDKEGNVTTDYRFWSRPFGR